MTLKRINKALAEAGIASRRSCDEMVLSGRIAVNGQVVTELQTLIETDSDQITVDGRDVKFNQQKVYFVLNKPIGFLCSNKRLHHNQKLVIDLFASIPHRLFTIGRLDKDTRGLIIVTNDGDFAQKVIHPSRGLQKEYLVKVTQEITAEQLIRMSQGIVIDNVPVRPVKVIKVRRGTFKITVSEGKKREVRLIVEAAGLKLESLTRIRIGSLVLGNLPIGLWRPMTTKERQALLQEK
ncbi:MAG: yjbC [Chlamydiales bacterium]|jgi:23S rRNA pseudouridine2605 synthase|nr:yjbC [Chlamydiales bacterium]